MSKRYPFGHIFSFDELGIILPSEIEREPTNKVHPSQTEAPGFEDDLDEEVDIEELSQAIPGARAVIFLPMWDFQEHRWFSAAIGWTTEPTRILDNGDLNYLSAFGNSIMAELSRLGTIALSQAKSDFISSVSHELRSPLHGVLAAAELLRKPSMSLADKSMLDSIESCGQMLLDTINHLLDYAQYVHGSLNAGGY